MYWAVVCSSPNTLTITCSPHRTLVFLQAMDETSWAECYKYKFIIQSMYLEEDIIDVDELSQAVSTPPPPPPPLLFPSLLLPPPLPPLFIFNIPLPTLR